MYYVASLEDQKAILCNTETDELIEIDRVLLPDDAAAIYPLKLYVKKHKYDTRFDTFSSILIPYAINEKRFAAFTLRKITEIDARLLPPGQQTPCILHIAVDWPIICRSI